MAQQVIYRFLKSLRMHYTLNHIKSQRAQFAKQISRISVLYQTFNLKKSSPLLFRENGSGCMQKNVTDVN